MSALRLLAGLSILSPRALDRPARTGWAVEPTFMDEKAQKLMNRIKALEAQSLRDDLPAFQVGDNVKVSYKVVEGTRERVQIFQGVIIRRHGAGARETFTVRKISFAVGVERTFPVHSPKIVGVEIVSRGKVRRAKLYFLRDKIGKAARLKEKRF